jgi:hypothetical protein
MASIHKVSGESNLYHVHFFDQHSGHPDQGLPGHGHPDNTLPGMGGPVDPGYGRPGGPHPGNRPPGSHPVFPDNTLPSTPPPHIQPGATLVLVRDAGGVWHYASLPPGSAPPQPVHPIAPGGQPRPDQGLPPTPTPKA